MVRGWGSCGAASFGGLGFRGLWQVLEEAQFQASEVLGASGTESAAESAVPKMSDRQGCTGII